MVWDQQQHGELIREIKAKPVALPDLQLVNPSLRKIHIGHLQVFTPVCDALLCWGKQKLLFGGVVQQLHRLESGGHHN